ncbi:hypothetical protein ARMSODRAFT_805662 [Armillaria solidipes]|uniref:Uncharacterized protein n=1 Tax=Armillaria solidipes TaxID=1076256 RepID=A0A2H3AJY1_9AGAR|nr:hypothetical protein ARMSODRAFT_805662 [Armillaria solidipes]
MRQLLYHFVPGQSERGSRQSSFVVCYYFLAWNGGPSDETGCSEWTALVPVQEAEGLRYRCSSGAPVVVLTGYKVPRYNVEAFRFVRTGFHTYERELVPTHSGVVLASIRLNSRFTLAYFKEKLEEWLAEDVLVWCELFHSACPGAIDGALSSRFILEDPTVMVRKMKRKNIHNSGKGTKATYCPPAFTEASGNGMLPRLPMSSGPLQSRCLPPTYHVYIGPGSRP